MANNVSLDVAIMGREFRVACPEEERGGLLIPEQVEVIQKEIDLPLPGQRGAEVVQQQGRAAGADYEATLDLIGFGSQVYEHLRARGVAVEHIGIVANAPIEQASPEDWGRVIGINLTGTFHGCAAAFEAVRDWFYERRNHVTDLD